MLKPTNDWSRLSIAERIELVLRTFSDMRIRPLDWTPEAMRIARRGHNVYARHRNVSFGYAAWKARVAMINKVLTGPGDAKARRAEWTGDGKPYPGKGTR